MITDDLAARCRRLMQPEAENPLWHFSLRFYGEAGVADACLAIQDEAGADVNILLFLFWCAATGRPLDAGRIAAADAGVGSWRTSVIEPLRRVRRAMKADLLPFSTEPCRDKVKAIELDAERLSQEALFAMAPPALDSITDAPAKAEAHLMLYARHLGRELPDAPLRALLAAFGTCPG